MNSPAALVGVPYRRNGEGLDGLDCYTLVRLVRERYFGLPTPLAYTPAQQLSAPASAALGWHHARRLWTPCTPHPGCVVGMARWSRGRLHHCGVLIDEGVLHAMADAGVMLTPLERLRSYFAQVECFECRN
jgi:hypothetical protein